MHSRPTHLLWTTALSFMVACAGEPTSSSDSPEPINGGELGLTGRVVDVSGDPVPFVPVRLGAEGGPIVASDESGAFTFPDVPAGPHDVYASDELMARVGKASVTVAPESSEDPVTIELQDCHDALAEGEIDPVLLDICFGHPIDLPPAEPVVTIDALEISDGTGYSNGYATGLWREDLGLTRPAIFVYVPLTLPRGGIREFTFADHHIVGSYPDADKSALEITVEDEHGAQNYVVREGSFRLDISEGQGATPSFVLTGSDLVLDYGKWPDVDVVDPSYTLIVSTLRIEGTLDIDLPPSPPTGDLTITDFSSDYVFGDYDSAQGVVNLFAPDHDKSIFIEISLDPALLALPGTARVELPVGAEPDFTSNTALVPAESGVGSGWNFQLVSFDVTTAMTEFPECGEQLTLTLENLVFRYVAWDYDQDGQYVYSFGDQTLTVDRIDVDNTVYDVYDPLCL